ncbi:MAG: dihydrolipoamide acetyltransferase family protein [Christensenellaceae bacterium]
MSEIMSTPASKRLSKERGIDLRKVKPSGITGYIQLSDVINFRGVKATPLAIAIAEYNNIDIEQVHADGGVIRKSDVLAYIENPTGSTTIPVDGMRKVIAQRMMQSMQASPQYTMFMEVDVFAVKKFFAAYKAECLENGQPKPTLSDVFIKACAMALKEHPIVNSTFYDTYIEMHRDINVGLAVALENGLIVPNIKNSDLKSLAEITADRIGIVGRAREGKLAPDDCSGGTFTITNLGQFPVEYATPVINQPESAIIGLGTMVDKVVVIDGNIGIHPMMGISVTFDHRHVDGAAGGKFMGTLKEILSNPQSLRD